VERMGVQRRFRIEGKAEGIVYGVYPGDTPEEALEVMYADSGAGVDGTRIRGLDFSAWIVTQVGIAPSRNVGGMRWHGSNST